ncbi:hypothetical protein ABIB94_007090 [Bradyrhizobium sp. JR7.2]|uniref:hypothetical protein n=1 Tax=Bradyrhizobium sp. JR7.2 TaxID=3156375 RepID=UPI003396D63C
MANFFDQFDSSDSAPSAPRTSSRYADAISTVESGGNYREVGPHTGSMGRALGKYQVMSANVGPWSKEILGREVSPGEFISDPKIQDAIFEGKFGQYVDKYGPDGAARAWFAGEKGMKNPNAKDVFGTTVAEYSRRFNKALPPQDARGAVEQFGADQPEAMAFAATDKPNASPAKPEAKNFFDQFDAAPAATAPRGRTTDRLYVSPAKPEPKEAVPGSAAPDRGVVDATARGVASGLSSGFIDEMAGVRNAGSDKIPEFVAIPGVGPVPARAIIGAYRLLANGITGADPQASTDYESARDEMRAGNKAAEENHPVLYKTGQVGGALAVPGGAVASGTKLVRVGAGIATGAGLGGLAGAGEGEGAADTLSRGVVGAGVGGVLGGVAVPVIQGAGYVANKVGEAFRPIGNLIRGATNVDEQAARNIANARARDARSGNINGMSEAEAEAARAGGAPVINADVGGENVRALARSAANTSAEGRAALDHVISDRFATQKPRTAQFLKRENDFPDTQAAIDGLQEAARKANRPAYAKAYSEGQHIWDGGLEQLSQAPVMQQAIRMAFVTGRNRAALDGFAPIKNPFVMNRETGLLELQPGAVPNLQFWDHVKRNLDKLGAEGQAFSRALRDHLDDIVPSYGAARAGAAKFFGAENALEAGAKFATMSGADAISIGEARKALAKFTPAERKLFETGFVANLIAKVENLKDGQDIVKNIFNSEFARHQIELALGPAKAARLEAHLQVERALDRLRPAVQGNSSTARQLLEAGIAGATSPTALAGAVGTGSSLLSGDVGPGDALLAGLTFAGRKGKLRIDENVARRVAQMLASDNPGAINAATQVVARTPWLLTLFRKLELPAARIGGQQAPIAPALQAAGVGRADDQPNVPRPRP